MKITVKADKAEELEREIAVYLSQNTDPLTGAPVKLVADDQQKGSPKDISMAEILFNLKDKFEIIDGALKDTTDLITSTSYVVYHKPKNDTLNYTGANKKFSI
jgi:hypothetical protein